nr:immunoglobulin heavy chain junction region [Mus musculus]
CARSGYYGSSYDYLDYW